MTSILDFCNKKYIKNHTINSDDTIDVDGDVDLRIMLEDDLKKLPVKFGKVSGFFDCSTSNLTTLENCPKYVGRNFYSDIITHHILGNVHGNIYSYKQKVVI
jgi:hypothetical protein